MRRSFPPPRNKEPLKLEFVPLPKGGGHASMLIEVPAESVANCVVYAGP